MHTSLQNRRNANAYGLLDLSEQSGILADVIRRGCMRYDVVCAFISGSAVLGKESDDLDVCFVVEADVLHRGRWTVQNVHVDVFVAGRDRIIGEIEAGRRQHLVSLYATGRVVFGDHRQADLIQGKARAVAAMSPPVPTKEAIFRARCQPHDLLRKFKSLRSNDKASASFVVAALVRSCVEGFFVVNRVWTAGVKDTVGAVCAANSVAGKALKKVLLASPKEICEEPAMLDAMVRCLVGSEPTLEEHWASDAPGLRRGWEPPQGSVRAFRLAEHPARAEIRSYEGTA